MPNFKKDKSKFTMKNMNYYKGKFATSEASSPYNKNKSTAYKAGKSTAKSLASMAEQLATGQISRNLGRVFGKNVSRFGGKTNAADLKNRAMETMKYKETSPEITEEFVNIPVQKFRKDLVTKTIPKATRTMKKEVKQRFIPNTGYTPQTKSRKDPSTDITPQTQKSKKMYLAKEERKVRKSAGWPTKKTTQGPATKK